jgi:hypothetical protein
MSTIVGTTDWFRTAKLFLTHRFRISRESNIENQWLDMRGLLVTDSNFREANVRMDESQIRLKKAADFSKYRIYIGQGFIEPISKATLRHSDVKVRIIQRLLSEICSMPKCNYLERCSGHSECRSTIVRRHGSYS